MNIMIEPNKNLESLIPYKQGKIIKEVKRELGLSRIIKLASNENAFGTSPKAVDAIKRMADKAYLYPDGAGYELKQKLSAHYSVAAERIVLGNGSDEIIELLIKAFMNEGDELICAKPSFLIYSISAQSANVKCRTVSLLSNFEHDLNGMLDFITDKTRLIFICNPNNPTGTMMVRDKISAFMKKVPDNILVIFDEAYYDFARRQNDYPDTINEYLNFGKSVAILRTFSKAYGLAGLRIGFGFMPERIAVACDKVRQPFNTNSLAQTAAIAALDDTEFLKKTIENNKKQYDFLFQQLKKIGVTPFPSAANFILIDVKHNADRVFQEMLNEGVIIRPMSAYNLKTYIRVTIGDKSDNEIFLEKLEKVLS